ncbi:MAG: hypothetical protein AAGN82_27410 [Myxococcota bacterium]
MKQRHLALFAAACAMILARGPRPADACGGSDHGQFAALGPVSATVVEIGYPDAMWAMWGNARREELRFLHPYRLDDPTTMGSLWSFSHGGSAARTAPTTAVLDAALGRGDAPGARQEAQRLIEAVYAMPPVPAAHHRDVFKRAVGVIDDQGAAWREHQALRDDFARLVPDGWAQVIRKKVSPRVWAQLRQGHAAWHRRHAGHPLADQVYLDEVRVHYFAGDADAAWRRLIGPLLARRPARALAELRFLLLQGMLPSDDVIGAIGDDRLRAALVPRLARAGRMPPARWDAWWRAAAKARTRGAPWGVNFQERLLFAAAATADQPLPPAFPRHDATPPPSPLWGKLRGAALARRGHLRAAERQLVATPTDAMQARLLTQVRLERGQLRAATTVKGLADDVRRYLIRIRGTDAMVDKLRTVVGPVGHDARQEWAQRLIARNRWREAAATIERDDAARADLFRRAANMASGPDGTLRAARFLVTHRSDLFDRHRNGFYRGLSFRQDDASLPLEERKAIARYLERASADWMALRRFIAWLEGHPDHADAPVVLQEADAAYNRLINRGGGDHYFWGRHAASHPDVVALRRIGAKIRSRP